ncbi:hypothetical protein [Micromonospora okii]|uniref:hypothetical protein n=1 Tax=Micromonospora okii TaxID=1182970 RepID=UPI001E2BD0A1|nr:hypothetical protein [Micromonospora okii]
MDVESIAARVIAQSRAESGRTAAEFDHDIAVNGIGGVFGPLGNAVGAVANAHMPEVVPGQDNRLAEREANTARMWDALRPALEAYGERCRARKYRGWSSAAQALGQRIRYAD